MAAIARDWCVLTLLLTASLAAARSPSPPRRTAERVVYRHATLIDGTGAAARRDMAVITRGERIEAVLADAALTPALARTARASSTSPAASSSRA